MTFARLRTGNWYEIPGRTFKGKEGFHLPVVEFAGLAPDIDPQDLLNVTRKLVVKAYRNQHRRKQARINRMRLELARACLDKLLWTVDSDY